MFDQDTLELAREAGFNTHGLPIPHWVEPFTNFIIEECAKVCESQEAAEYATGKVDHNERSWCSANAAAIRGMKK